MDPQTTWDQLLAAYAAGEWDQIAESATALLEWLDRDGFPPRIHPGRDLGPEWDRTLARAGCALALDMLQAQWQLEGKEPSHAS